MTSREFAARLPEQLPGITEMQLEVAADAHDRKPTQTSMALVKALAARNPVSYFVAVCIRIVDENPLPRAKQQRHDLDTPECNDCGDSGFVILTRELGPDAKAGDAAPCHCAAGLQKQKRYGTVHYGRDDYERAVPESERISLQEYAQTEEGQADPNLETMRTLWKRQQILKDVEE